MAQGLHSSQQDDARETNLVQMNVKPCYSTSWLIWFGLSRSLALPLSSHSYFKHTLTQIVETETLQHTANNENKPPLPSENERSHLIQLEQCLLVTICLRGIFCVWSWWGAKFSIVSSLSSLGNCISFSVITYKHISLSKKRKSLSGRFDYLMNSLSQLMLLCTPHTLGELHIESCMHKPDLFFEGKILEWSFVTFEHFCSSDSTSSVAFSS